MRRRRKAMRRTGAPTKRIKGMVYEDMGDGTTRQSANWRKQGFNARVSGGHVFVRPK